MFQNNTLPLNMQPRYSLGFSRSQPQLPAEPRQPHGCTSIKERTCFMCRALWQFSKHFPLWFNLFFPTTLGRIYCSFYWKNLVNQDLGKLKLTLVISDKRGINGFWSILCTSFHVMLPYDMNGRHRVKRMRPTAALPTQAALPTMAPSWWKGEIYLRYTVMR